MAAWIKSKNVDTLKIWSTDIFHFCLLNILCCEKMLPGEHGGVGPLAVSHAKTGGAHHNVAISSSVHHQGTAAIALQYM